MNDIVKREETEIITADKINNYLDAFGFVSQLNAGEKKQFIEIAMAYNLNPFKREIYCVPYDANVKKPDGSWGKERKLSIITGYEVYLKRAERVGALDGWDVVVEGTGEEMKAVVTIHRKDWSHPFKHEVYFSETAKKDKDGKPQSMWKTMPKFMLKKVAIAQGFRMAFPDEFGGMPYAADELPDNMTAGFNEVKNVTPESEQPKQDILKPETSAENKQTPPPNVDENGEIKKVQPGEQLKSGHWFWKIPQDQKINHMPEGYWYSKVDGVWTCTKKAA